MRYLLEHPIQAPEFDGRLDRKFTRYVIGRIERVSFLRITRLVNGRTDNRFRGIGTTVNDVDPQLLHFMKRPYHRHRLLLNYV